MAGLPADTDSKAETGDDARARPNCAPVGGTPRWVKGFGIATLLAVMAFAIMHDTGHGMAHLTHWGIGSQTLPPSAAEHGTHHP
jgi:hypothetical protein